MALITHMVRVSALDADDIDDMAAALDEQGERDAARICRAAFAQALAPSASDWNAQRARNRMRLVSSDGGNETT